MTDSKFPHLFVLALLLGFCAPAWGQSGSVTYVHTLRFDIDLPPEMEQFAEYMPESVTTTYSMDFSEAASLTTAVTGEVDMPGDAASLAGDGPNIKISFRGAGSDSDAATTTTYVDLDEGSYVEQRDFLGRTFLITGPLPDLAWKLSGEEGQMLDHHVLKATAIMDSSAVEAWFTPEIPASVGPGQFGGLPGLILMLSIDEGKQLYQANEIQLDTAPLISPPEEGREVTKEEFEAIVAERMEDRGNGLGGAIRSIIIRQ